MATGGCLMRCSMARFLFRTPSQPSLLPNRALQHLLLRHSSTVPINLRKMRIEDDEKAREVAVHLRPDERRRLLEAIERYNKEHSSSQGGMTKDQARQLFLFNMMPFIGFGFLDNMVMIVAGEYIDQSIGVWLTISTMAAAALGNLISDVSGVALAHYVEFLVCKCGLKHPVLTSEQLESSMARTMVNLGRAFGLVVGCLLGMFPLLFFDSPKQTDTQDLSAA